jgi:Ran GTPase-activating protein (RanGAP) involved in mRNA processing and transport
LRSSSGLQSLRLAKCQLGDRTAAAVIEALIRHKSLTQVDLSANAIGSMVLNAKHRGHAGATLSVQHLATLCRENMTLRSLNLSWNSLSGEHVRVLSASW